MDISSETLHLLPTNRHISEYADFLSAGEGFRARKPYIRALGILLSDHGGQSDRVAQRIEVVNDLHKKVKELADVDHNNGFHPPLPKEVSEILQQHAHAIAAIGTVEYAGSNRLTIEGLIDVSLNTVGLVALSGYNDID